MRSRTIGEQFGKRLTPNQGGAVTASYEFEQQLILNRVSPNMADHPSIIRFSALKTHESHSESGG